MEAEKMTEEIYTEIESEKPGKEQFESISLSELLSMQFPESKWVIEKLIPHQGITLISGAPASFKTWLLLRMAIDIAKGERLFGQFMCEQNKILIIDEENHLRLVQERMKLLGAEATLPIYYLSQKGFLVSKKGMIKSVLEICKEKGIDVIFIDSLVRINDAEENDASQMSKVFRDIKRLCQGGKTVVITHHERKEGSIRSSAQNRLRGSSDIQASVDCHLSISRDRRDKSKISIEQAKLRSDEEIASFDLAIKKSEEKTEFSYLGLHSEDAKKKDLAKEVVLSVLEEEKEGLLRKEIVKRVKSINDIGEKSIREAIDELIVEENIFEKQGSKNAKICYLAEFYQESEEPQKVLI